MKSNILEFPDQRNIEEEAWEWIIKLEGDASPKAEDINAFHKWLRSSPQHKVTFNKIATHWNGMDVLSELVIPSEKKEQTLSGKFISILLWIISPAVLLYSVLGVAKNKSATLLYSSLAVASLSCITVASVFLFLTFNATIQTQFSTGIGEQQTITLQDGSILLLNTNSQLEIDFDTATRRIKLKKGEVHFDVAHDPDRPFEIFANNRMVRAIGTAFSVLIEEDDIKVTVTEGKVELGLLQEPVIADVSAPTTDSANKTVILSDASPTKVNETIIGALTAGQSAVITAEQKGKQIDIQEFEEKEMRRQLAWLEGNLIFAGEPLHEVIKEVSRYSSVYIELMNEDLENIRIGGQFQLGQTEGFLDVLELGFGLTVHRVNSSHVQISAIKN